MALTTVDTELETPSLSDICVVMTTKYDPENSAIDRVRLDEANKTFKILGDLVERGLGGVQIVDVSPSESAVDTIKGFSDTNPKIYYERFKDLQATRARQRIHAISRAAEMKERVIYGEAEKSDALPKIIMQALNPRYEGAALLVAGRQQRSFMTLPPGQAKHEWDVINDTKPGIEGSNELIDYMFGPHLFRRVAVEGVIMNIDRLYPDMVDDIVETEFGPYDRSSILLNTSSHMAAALGDMTVRSLPKIFYRYPGSQRTAESEDPAYIDRRVRQADDVRFINSVLPIRIAELG